MMLTTYICYHSKELRCCGQCLIIENEDFVKRIAVYSYFSNDYQHLYEFDVTWIVQDIRHKLEKFNFFNKFVILGFLHK